MSALTVTTNIKRRRTGDREAVVGLGAWIEVSRAATLAATRTFRCGGVPLRCLLDAFDGHRLPVEFLIVVSVSDSRTSMSEEKYDEVGLAAKPWRPSEVLSAAEGQAVQTAKLLRAFKAQLGRLKGEASVEEAIVLADLIESLSRHGRAQTAAQASDISLRVEIILDQLCAKMDALL
jgi:hypothetical protein